jgi:hypothetical protein
VDELFSCSGGPGAVSIKSMQDTLSQTCVSIKM